MFTRLADDATTFNPELTAPNTPPAAAPVPVAPVATEIAHCPNAINPAVRFPFAILIVALVTPQDKTPYVPTVTITVPAAAVNGFICKI